ncbi:hypothetical protein SAMD00019534_016810 [Acytostelium subglobosum LB1]|uniref:hypothetical protein n=1 Tax=Acytostelium subglobosum LB1 TaxID=1410327 RepID=UPI000644E93E|nr:hypothetical protein SAMD00019534_016810 [Acytostelium subglobosum LB1]GAM18506.1 hypothetical protein SAMD00019534_016810 [Acytostelium subglobosum LB1]|eukprot:XP_012757726.1 hypothetical protein SAMD00019534_016810 [Acytostelium subglobosum LB1]
MLQSRVFGRIEEIYKFHIRALDLVKQRSGINVREWNIKALDISTKSRRPNLPFIHLMAIIVNYLWHYIANHLFGNKEALLAKLSLVCITSFKSLLRHDSGAIW